jgi:hypothetical protein
MLNPDAIHELFTRIKTDVERGDDWPGGDTVQVLSQWFTDLGYDIDAPVDQQPKTAPYPRTGQPEMLKVRDAEIHIYDPEPGTDDVSDTYVLDVFGLSLLMRIGRGQPDEVYVHIDTETDDHAQLAVEVGNNGANDYSI